jgi:hypothetical protein
MLTRLARHWRDPTARRTPRDPYSQAVVQDTRDGQTAVSDVAVLILSSDIGTIHWAVIGISVLCRVTVQVLAACRDRVTLFGV